MKVKRKSNGELVTIEIVERNGENQYVREGSSFEWLNNSQFDAKYETNINENEADEIQILKG